VPLAGVIAFCHCAIICSMLFDLDAAGFFAFVAVLRRAAFFIVMFSPRDVDRTRACGPEV
jgi:hypothetical protein